SLSVGTLAGPPAPWKAACIRDGEGWHWRCVRQGSGIVCHLIGGALNLLLMETPPDLRTNEHALRTSARGQVPAVPCLKIQLWGIPDPIDPTGPPQLGPKRAGRICQLFYRSRTDDVGQYAVNKPLRKEGKKLWTKAPKLQPLLIPRVLQERLRLLALKSQQNPPGDESQDTSTVLLESLRIYTGVEEKSSQPE
uniref:Small ribosomal subunit protein eS6 n=1 Tax=Chrysemys picta bellii TaxID=8478 RepID=A0A8C3I0P9_CHRPI